MLFYFICEMRTQLTSLTTSSILILGNSEVRHREKTHTQPIPTPPQEATTAHLWASQYSTVYTNLQRFCLFQYSKNMVNPIMKQFNLTLSFKCENSQVYFFKNMYVWLPLECHFRIKRNVIFKKPNLFDSRGSFEQ